MRSVAREDLTLTTLGALVDNIDHFFRLSPGFPLRHVSYLLRRRFHTAAIQRSGPMTFRPRSTDVRAIVEVFRRGAYDLSGLRAYERLLARYRSIIADGRRPVIVDAGANIGAAAIFFAQTFPEAMIRAVEPDPDNAELLRINAHARPNIEVIEAAIGGEIGQVSLSNPLNEAWGVRTQRDAGGTVPTTTIPALLRRNSEETSLFLVKIDIEGFESDLFSANLDWLDHVAAVIIEPHDWLLPGDRSSFSFRKAMLERDFEMVICGESLVFSRV